MRRETGRAVYIEVLVNDSSEITEDDQIFYRQLAEVCENVTGEKPFLSYEIDSFEDKTEIELYASIIVIVADPRRIGESVGTRIAKQAGIPVLIIHQKIKEVYSLINKISWVWTISYEENRREVFDHFEDAISDLFCFSEAEYENLFEFRGGYDV